ncbi:MAG: AAA family ATPase [Cruoricaptor ignavus]|nr:AAA family ATPase [Cruoricaptor ignavus]
MENKYQDRLLQKAKEIDNEDKIAESFLSLTRQLTKNNDVLATKKIFYLLSQLVKTDEKKLLQLSMNYNELLLKYYGFEEITKIVYSSAFDENIEQQADLSLSEIINQLDQLIGLENVKKKVKDLIAFQKVQQLRAGENLVIPDSTLHLAFTGNPGTGKTTVARIIGEIYKKLGLLSKGHFIEVSRTDLIAGYQGQTALKVKKVIDRAKGGVLFIDEAYSITENEHSDSYGRECLTELTKALEDYRSDLVVIVAGYTAPMEVFFNSNPGLKSRFNSFIEFEDYSNEQLREIFLLFVNQNDYSVNESTLNQIDVFFEGLKPQDFNTNANGRFVRNLFDDLVMEHARRVSKIENPTLQDLREITGEDILIFS